MRPMDIVDTCNHMFRGRGNLDGQASHNQGSLSHTLGKEMVGVGTGEVIPSKGAL